MSPPSPTSARLTSTGKLGISGATKRLQLGDKVRLIPGHCDPTVNLYDWCVCIRNNRVEQLRPITTRSAVYGPLSLRYRRCRPRTTMASSQPGVSALQKNMNADWAIRDFLNRM